MSAANEEILQEHEQRINRVVDYIANHLDQDLSLDLLADVACFSKYHFHRVFNTLMGETVNQFIRRLHLEKSAYLLIFDRKKSITEIAFECGFSSSQNFSKAFKVYFSTTPGDLRNSKDFRQFETLQPILPNIDNSKIGNIERNSGKDITTLSEYFSHRNVEMHRIHLATQRRGTRIGVDVKQIPDRTVAYVRHIGPYVPELITPTFLRLFMWADPRDLMNEQAEILGVSWDHPNVTPEAKCRYDACITMPDGFQPDGDISVQQLQGGKCAVYRREVADKNFKEPWIELMRDWLPTSGYQLDERPCYEVYHDFDSKVANDAEQTDSIRVIDFCLPVKPI